MWSIQSTKIILWYQVCALWVFILCILWIFLFWKLLIFISWYLISCKELKLLMQYFHLCQYLHNFVCAFKLFIIYILWIFHFHLLFKYLSAAQIFELQLNVFWYLLMIILIHILYFMCMWYIFYIFDVNHQYKNNIFIQYK